MKWILLPMQLAGLAFSVALVLATLMHPDIVEVKLRDVAIAKIDQSLERAMDVEPSAALSLNFELSEALQQRIDILRQNGERMVAALIAQSVLKNCTYECVFWQEAAGLVDKAVLERIAKLEVAQQNIVEFVADQYELKIDALTKDLQRFGFVNLLVFALTSACILGRGALSWRFVAFSVALSGYAFWAAYGYIFDQNWVLTILLNDWAAPAHQSMMVLVSMLLADWLFLQGLISQAVSSSISRICNF